MNGLTPKRSLVTARGLLAVLVAMAVPVLVSAAEDAQERVIVGPDKEIYDTQEAADLVAEARTYDPISCPRERADRDKAALLYEKAIAAQPGARINAPLANRIAQLFAFYEDKEKKARPIRSKASQWWNRCLEFSTPKQLLWAQAQMGLASMAVIGGDHRSALAAYNKILDMDLSQVELPDWKVWPDGSSDRGKAALEQERARLRESSEGVQARAAAKQFYVLCRISKSAALVALQDAATRYKGTKAGDRASDMMTQIRKRAGTDPWALPDLMLAGEPQEQPQAPHQPEDQPQKTAMAHPATPAASQASGSDYRGLGVAAFATVAVALAIAGIVRLSHRKRL